MTHKQSALFGRQALQFTQYKTQDIMDHGSTENGNTSLFESHSDLCALSTGHKTLCSLGKQTLAQFENESESYGSLNRNGPIGSQIRMLAYWGGELLDRAQEVWPCWGECGLDRGSVSLRVGFAISRAQPRSCVSLFLLPVDPDLELSSTSPATSACMPPDSQP